MEDIVHHLVRCVNDAHLFRGGFERFFEKGFVQVLDDRLPPRVGTDALGSHTDGGIEFSKFPLLRFRFQRLLPKYGQHLFHCQGYRVAFGKIRTGEQRLKYRKRDDMLCKHLHRLGFGD